MKIAFIQYCLFQFDVLPRSSSHRWLWWSRIHWGIFQWNWRGLHWRLERFWKHSLHRLHLRTQQHCQTISLSATRDDNLTDANMYGWIALILVSVHSFGMVRRSVSQHDQSFSSMTFQFCLYAFIHAAVCFLFLLL